MPITLGNTSITGLGVGGLPAGTVNATSLANDAVTVDKINNLAVTQAKLATAVIPIGVGQTWQNLTGSRVNGTTYTNTSGRPIMISFSTNFAAPNDVVVVVGGIEVYRWGITNNFTTRDSGGGFIVPPDVTYSITAPGGLSYWAELR